MDYPLTFARNFSRLVWLLLNEGSAFEAQIATLRSLVNTSREGKVILGTHDLHLHVNGVPVSEHFTGGEDLTAQLIGHSVKEIAADQDSSPADLLVLARLLASSPVPGDGGANVCARLTAVDLRTVRVSVDSSGFSQASQESLAEWDDSANPEGLVSPAAAGPFVADLAAEQGEERASATVEKPFSTIFKLFEQLDAATSATGVSRHLDGLVQLANDSARKDDLEAVADILHGIVAREAAVSDRGLRRVYGMAIRRLSAPGVLKCVTSLLPKRRENYDRYMSIIVRTEDAGAEALVDALSSAPSIPERRLYFDSFLKLSTGVRTLVYMLGDDRWYVVRNAANLLGDMRAPEADAPLTRLLDHEDDRVRTAAVAALARLGTVSGVKGLRAALKDASAEVRERAAESLGMAKVRRSAATLIKALDAESDTHVQAAIIAALGQIGSADAVDKLVEIAKGESGTLKQPDIALRVAAVHALGNTETPAASTALQSLLKDKHKDVRGAASWFTLAKSASI